MRRISLITLFTGSVVAMALSVSSCDDSSGVAELPENADEAILNYANIVLQSYKDSHSAAVEMDLAIENFVADPDAAGFDDARDAWLATREPYLQTEVYRFYEGPIDRAASVNPPREEGPEVPLNAWPLDESAIDYVEGDADSGIVNDPEITIDADTLISMINEDAERITTGFHAIEFLLWGQDIAAGDQPCVDTTAGNRAFTDYTSATNHERRGLYLTTVSDLLVTQLDGLIDEWDEGSPTNFRAEFLAEDSNETLRRILTGMYKLTGFETGGERLQTALESGEQDDEHSCFSDNTHRDMVQDIQGIYNVWTGNYAALDSEDDVEGVGIRDVVSEVDTNLAAKLDQRILTSYGIAQMLRKPFDCEIHPSNSSGNDRVLALIDSLREQKNLIGDVLNLFGYTYEPDTI